MIILLIGLLPFIDPPKNNNRLVINDVPFGQIQQGVVCRYFYSDIQKVEKKARLGKLESSHFMGNSIEPNEFGLDLTSKGTKTFELLCPNSEFNSIEIKYQPFRTLRWISNYDSLSTWLMVVDHVLSGFNDTTIYTHSEVATPSSKLKMPSQKIPKVKTICVHYYDPRARFGKDIVRDFQELVFYMNKITPGYFEQDSVSGRKVALLADHAFEKFVTRYPDGGPYFPSLFRLITRNYVSAGKLLRENKFLPLIRVFKFYAGQKSLMYPEILNFLKYRFPEELKSWSKSMAPSSLKETLVEIRNSVSNTDDNGFKVIFEEECTKAGISF